MSAVKPQVVTSPRPNLGTLGYLAIFACSLAAVMLIRAARLPLAAGICLLVAGWVYPEAFRALLRPRWLVMIALLALPPVFLVGEADHSLGGVSYSSLGLESAVQIALRILVVLVSVGGLNRRVDITALAGLLERAGLHGLGFSVGVAMNLLPALGESATHAWHSLWMRGGFRRQRLRAARLLAVTVLSGALRRAEEVALAAEVRAFSPRQARRLPLKRGRLDWVALLVGVLTVLVFLWLP